MFCQQTVEELRGLVKDNSDFPPVLLIYPASIADGEEFFNRFWPEARAVSDSEGKLYHSMGVQKASLKQMFGPGVWFRAIQAMKAGYSVGKVIGNPWLLPGMFLVNESRIVWSWKFRNIGDHPDFEGITRIIRREEV